MSKWHVNLGILIFFNPSDWVGNWGLIFDKVNFYSLELRILFLGISFEIWKDMDLSFPDAHPDIVEKFKKDGQ